MACGCNKRTNSTPSTGHVVRNSVRNTSPTPQVFNQTQQPQTNINASGISAERRKLQAIRRDAIRKTFNK